MPHDPKAQVVLVTGASSGIGRACCDRLHASGRVVCGTSRRGPGDVPWSHLVADVTDDANIEKAVAEVVSRHGRLDAVVHAAGVSLTGPVEETTLDEARQHFDVNYFGTLRVLRAALPVMRAQRSGRIVVIGSIGGLIGLRFLGQYSASKFALDGLLEAMRPEIAPFGIEATIVHPGDFRTALATSGTTTAASQPGSAYWDAFQRATAFYHQAEAQARSPDVLARRIDRLLDRRNLPPRIVVGTTMETIGVIAKRSLPARLFERILAASYGG